MSDQLFIILQGGLAFGAPLTLAIIELIKLRKKTPAPVGGGEPELVNVVAFPSRGTVAPASTDAGSEPEQRLAA
jgi:hypothetical protein